MLVNESFYWFQILLIIFGFCLSVIQPTYLYRFVSYLLSSKKIKDKNKNALNTLTNGRNPSQQQVIVQDSIPRCENHHKVYNHCTIKVEHEQIICTIANWTSISRQLTFIQLPRKECQMNIAGMHIYMIRKEMIVSKYEAASKCQYLLLSTAVFPSQHKQDSGKYLHKNFNTISSQSNSLVQNRLQVLKYLKLLR